MRPLLAIACAAMLVGSVPLRAAPDFAPNPKQAFQGFVGVNPPRADVPVGALWIDGYGPVGEAASQDNLETVKSLSAISIDKNLQLDLSLGILNLFNIDPKARDHYTAHFNDLSIVRVKDISRLPGVKGEPRIVEALKAGTVTVSSDSEIGLNGQSTGFQISPVSGSTTNDRAKTYSIEAHDMFIAIHVATPEVVQSKEQELRIAPDGRSARIDDFLIVISAGSCGSAACPPALAVIKLNTQTQTSGAGTPVPATGTFDLPLPVPTSDGQGGLFDRVSLHWIAPCNVRKADGCRKEPRLLAHYEGTRLRDMNAIKAKGW